jgi:hypothetical protein
MKIMRYSWLLILVVGVLSACDSKDKYDPDELLTPNQKEALMSSIIRYVAKGPDHVDESERTKPKWDAYYADKMKAARFEKYAAKGDDFYFLISQPAPSTVEKRHATGGRFKLNDKGEFTEYEELFRTWKMVPDTLKRRSGLLFDKMVKGESLDRYLTKNSNGVEFIEFPDDNVHYNIEAREWQVVPQQ